jgi:hypothetical protein
VTDIGQCNNFCSEGDVNVVALTIRSDADDAATTCEWTWDCAKTDELNAVSQAATFPCEDENAGRRPRRGYDASFTSRVDVSRGDCRQTISGATVGRAACRCFTSLTDAITTDEHHARFFARAFSCEAVAAVTFIATKVEVELQRNSVAETVTNPVCGSAQGWGLTVFNFGCWVAILCVGSATHQRGRSRNSSNSKSLNKSHGILRVNS